MPIPATTSPSPSRKGLAGRTGIEADSACRLIPRRCDEHCAWRDRDRRPAGDRRTNIGNVERGRRVVCDEKAVDRNYQAPRAHSPEILLYFALRRRAGGERREFRRLPED